MTDSTKLAGLLDRVVEIAKSAGDEIRKVYRSGDPQTVLKEDDSPLTLADRLAHDLIVRELEKLTPDFPVISEESAAIDYSIRNSWERLWLVDPLDGTKEFLKKNGEFTVNIALVENGSPVLGVVHAPELFLTYFAAKGCGAFREKEGRRESLRTGDYRQKPFTIVASRSHAGPRLKAFLEAAKPDRVMSMGSALKLCLVAENSAQFYPRFSPTMEWDTAAAHCVLNEAGGQLLTLDGSPLQYNRRDMTNPSFVACGEPPFPWQQYAPPGD